MEIIYEDIKASPKEFSNLLRELINDIFVHQQIPKDWKKVNIYLIPKPKPWEFKLVNTHPITLLEMPQKVMMKILTKRISKVLNKYKILQGYQYAGLPSKSTFEPLRIINKIIQHANKWDKELWILALDMSKAYDRINIFMLKKAMLRIKFPENLINIIIDLFLERKNKIFTPDELTEEYKMQCGIDQGEIISPLLWIVYYNPLLTKIKESNLGYNIDGRRVLNLYENISEICNINFSGLSYMDDTNFISEDKENLEKILSIAGSFYDLNDIKINKSKSELLLRRKKGGDIIKKKIINFGKLAINIIPVDKKGSIRILGVWFNTYNARKHVIMQVKDEIRNCCDSFILRKRLTDKQISFIFNMLIIPRIEYRIQLIVLFEKECNSLIAPFRILFKHKLGLTKTVPNTIIHSKEFYNIKSKLDNQLQVKLTNFILQINNQEELGIIMTIHLLNLQELLLLSDNLLIQLSISDINNFKKIIKHLNNSFILDNIKLLKDANFNIKDTCINKNIFKIVGGDILIKEVLREKVYWKNFLSLKKLNLIFLDQILTLDGRNIITIKELFNKRFVNFKSPYRHLILNSWNEMELEILNNKDSRKIKQNIFNKIKINTIDNLKGFKFIKLSEDPYSRKSFIFTIKDNNIIYR